MRRNLTGRVFVLLMVVFSIVGPTAGRTMAQDGGLVGDDTYMSPQFGYTVSWGEDWSVRSRDVISNPGGYDTLTLRGENATLWIQGQGDTESAVDAVMRRITIEGDQDDVVSQNLEGDVPRAEMLVGRDQVLIEGYTLEDTDAVVVIVLSARERHFDESLTLVHDQVLFNDAQILTGSDVAETPAAGDEDAVDLTGDSSESATAEVSAPAEEETEEPTVPQDAEESPAPTNDDEQDAADDEDTAQQIPVDDDEQSEPAESAIDNGVFTSTLYDYTVAFDEAIWTVDDEFLNEGSDGFSVSNDLGSLTIWSWDSYGADAQACLTGESEYYGSEDPTVSDWMPAEDAQGDPIAGEGEGYAWGVFTLTYTDDEGEEFDLVDYIECRELPGDDAVVIVFASAPIDLYNEHLEQALEVVDSIEIEGESSETTSNGSEEPVEQEEVESGLSGSLFTSPAYGVTIDIPSQWRIENESLTSDNEELVLSNGISDVVIRATSEYQGGDLAGCVDFAAEESGLDLELDTNAEGEPFRAEGRREAYAHYRYTGDDGEEMMYFISCQDIVEGESVLILTQDVPYDEFANQRKFRAELQEAIVFPE